MKNPVFTVQLLGTCAKLPRVWTQRVQPANPAVWTYGEYPDRVARVGAVLTDELVSGTASYAFKGSKLYAVPLDRDIEPVGDVALRLEVDYSSAKKVSESTESAFPEPMPSPNPSRTLSSCASADTPAFSWRHGQRGCGRGGGRKACRRHLHGFGKHLVRQIGHGSAA